MAVGKVTGRTEKGLKQLAGKYYNSPKYEREGTPFEVAYCLVAIGKQPDDYDGPQRYCVNRVSRGDDGEHHERCRFHGGKLENDDNLEDKYAGDPTVPVTHGMYASDDTLRADLTEREEELFDNVLEWSEAYGWPPQEEDPAAYNALERLALQLVRERRSMLILLDEGEVEMTEVITDDGVTEIEDGHKLAEPTRHLQRQIQNLMDDLGLTPKARSRMDKQSSEASAADQIAEVASDAIDDEDGEYDPDDFE